MTLTSPMHVLLVVHHFPPSVSGGAGLYAYELARTLVQNGHKVSVFAAPKPAETDLASNEYRVEALTIDDIQLTNVCFNYRAELDSFGILLVDNPNIEAIFAESLLRIDPDIAHILSFEHITPAILRALYRNNIPTILTLTGKWLICPKATLLRSTGELCDGQQAGFTCARCILGETRYVRLMEELPSAAISWISRIMAELPLARNSGTINLIKAVDRRNRDFPKLLKHLDAVFSPSECHRSIFEPKALFGENKIVVFPHGHNADVAKDGRQKTKAKRIRFGFTGHLLPHKGVGLLVDAFLRLVPASAAELLLFGSADFDPAFAASLNEKASNAENVDFRGAFSHEDVGRILQEIDVMVIPTTCIENAPLVIAEARISRTPVIGSDTCGVSEWIRDGIDGLLFERGNANDLQRKMQWLVDDPTRISLLSANAPDVRTISDEVEHLIPLYYGLIRERQL